MKSLRNKVILSGIVLLFAFIATIGSTYAWFTVSSDTTVEGINLQVTAAENLLIKAKNRLDAGEDIPAHLVDAAYYENSIDFDYLESKGYFFDETSPGSGVLDPTKPWRLQPSTVLGGGSTTTAISLTYINNINAVMAGPAVSPTYSAATADSSTGHYVTIELYLLSQSSEAQNVALTNLVISSSAGNTGAQTAISNAVQVAFTFDDATTLSQTYVYGNDHDYDEEIPVTGQSPIGAPTADAPTVAVANPTGATASLYSLQPNTPTLVTVVIFIEGWDQDASNDIIRAFFDISFGFSIIE
jgi:hypothetical protein